MRAAEGGEEVIQRVLVGDVDGRQVEVRLVVLLVEDVVLAEGRSKRLRGAMRGGLWSSSPVPGAGMLTRFEEYCEARQTRGQGIGGSCLDAVAGEPGLELLVGGQRRSESTAGWPSSVVEDGVAGAVGVVGERVVAGHRAGHQAGVVAPVEAAPQAVQQLAVVRQRVLQVSGLVELLVVVDAEGKSGLAHGGSGSGHLRREEARGHRRGDEIGAEAVDSSGPPRAAHSRESWSYASRWGR